MKKIKLPLTDKVMKGLKAGDQVLLSGIVYTARDAAHQRMIESKKIPFPIKGATIYYVGPTPATYGRVIGAAGPTTASRMDAYTPTLLKKGLKGMIGKGKRSPEVIAAIKKHKVVYFAAIGGAGALLSKKIIRAKVIAYADLGTEAIYRLEIVDFPAIVAIDRKGRSFYK